MHAELTKLLDLQTKDLALLDADLRIKGIADEIARLDGQVEAAGRDLTVAKKRLEDGIRRREELEVRIDSYRTIQDRRRQRLEGVKGAREAQAVMTEVEMARTVVAKEEAEWVKAAELVHDAERAVKSVDDRIAALHAEQAPERERLGGELATLSGSRAEAKVARDGSAAEVEKMLRMRYDRLRSARTVAVVVPLRGEACGACFTSVPRNRRTQIRAGVLLDNCEACGVILYAEDVG